MKNCSHNRLDAQEVPRGSSAGAIAEGTVSAILCHFVPTLNHKLLPPMR
jgi:hypothetical protein